MALPALLKEVTACLKAASGSDHTQGTESETVASRMQSVLLALVENYTKSHRRKLLLQKLFNTQKHWTCSILKETSTAMRTQLQKFE